MRFAVPAFASLSVLACSPEPVGITGHWAGIAEHNGRVQQVELTIDAAAANGLLRIDEERVLRKVPIRTSGQQFSFEIDGDDHIIVSGERVGDEIRMLAQSGPIRVPIRLRQAQAPPQPPYREEELQFSSGGPRLPATLLMPDGPGPHPGIVLIHGSSTPSREDFRFYADAFARCGIGALIYDKRPVVGRDKVARTGLHQLAADARAGAERLRADPRVDAARVGYWGHSQGGWVAPIAAASDPGTAFVISFSGPVASFAEVHRYADTERLRRRGFPADDVEAAGKALDRLDEYARHGGNEVEFSTFLHWARQQRWAPLISLTNRVPTDEDRRTWLRWRDLDIDVAAYWKQLRAPVLALFGAKDDVVPVQLSARRLSDAMAMAGNGDVAIRVFDAGHSIERQSEFMPMMIRWVRAKALLPQKQGCP
jgi:dipeptidyl aminopeptidase/acylaminoacyl peptidase